MTTNKLSYVGCILVIVSITIALIVLYKNHSLHESFLVQNVLPLQFSHHFLPQSDNKKPVDKEKVNETKDVVQTIVDKAKVIAEKHTSFVEYLTELDSNQTLADDKNIREIDFFLDNSKKL